MICSICTVYSFYVLCVVDLLRAVKDILGTYKGHIGREFVARIYVMFVMCGVSM